MKMLVAGLILGLSFVSVGAPFVMEKFDRFKGETRLQIPQDADIARRVFVNHETVPTWIAITKAGENGAGVFSAIQIRARCMDRSYGIVRQHCVR